MYAEILAVDQESLDKLIISAMELQEKIIKNMGFVLEVMPKKGVFIIASSDETDKILPNDLRLMLTACGTELLKKRAVQGSVQILNKERLVWEF